MGPVAEPRPAISAHPTSTLANSRLAAASLQLPYPLPLSSASLAQDQSPVTPVSTLCAEARDTARRLLTHYVKVQGLVISQMLRKSVETRDWLSTLEPRNVRAVMKRVVEDTTAIDVQVLLWVEPCGGVRLLRTETWARLWLPSGLVPHCPRLWYCHPFHLDSQKVKQA